MLGAIAGDVIGSPYERSPIKRKDFALFSAASCFTDDTVMTIAIADALNTKASFTDKLKEWYKRYPHVGYGMTFAKWAAHPTDRDPYHSWGNGSAMRVSPIAWAFNALDDVLIWAKASAEVTHDHPEAIAGACAVAGCIFIARKGETKQGIRSFASSFGYKFEKTLEQIRPSYSFDVSCSGSVPQAIIAFLESTSFEDAIRNAVSLGGDSDTQACIAGAIAEAFYGGVPPVIRAITIGCLDEDLKRVVDVSLSKWQRMLT